MKLTPEIKAAIVKAIDQHGNVTQFAKSMGIAHSTVLFWMSGKTTGISGRVWAQKLRPALRPFLSDGSMGAGQFSIFQITGPSDADKLADAIHHLAKAIEGHDDKLKMRML